MTNETTASQPKGTPAESIGDNAQFRTLAFKLTNAIHEHRSAEIIGKAHKDLVAYIDNFRAPAAQASATIQAAPIYQRQEENGSWRDTTLLGKQVWEESGRPTRTVYSQRAATIQEPVMVAEPLDMVLPCDIKIGVMTIRKGCKLRTLVTRAESLHRMLMEHMPSPTPEEVAAFQAVLTSVNEEVRAPMVADHAGDLVKRLQQQVNDLCSLVEKYQAAATVKAVPSEALDWSEDFQHENGNYMNKCSACEKQFMGHKRRVTCKACAAPLADTTGGGE